MLERLYCVMKAPFPVSHSYALLAKSGECTAFRNRCLFA